MRIQHNIAAMNSLRQLTGNNNAVSKSLEKLSSGYRINRAGDDAAGLAISEKMRAQIRGLSMASKNAQDGISLVQTAEGALTETHSILQRMRELAVQASNGIYADEDREQTQLEIDALKTEVDRISTATTFNGIQLLDGSKSTEGVVKAANADAEAAIAEWLEDNNASYADAAKTFTAVATAVDGKAGEAGTAATKSTLTLDFTGGNAHEGDSVTINGTTYEFVTAANAAGYTPLVAGATVVTIGADEKATATALKNAIGNATYDVTDDTNGKLTIEAKTAGLDDTLAAVEYQTTAGANPVVVGYVAGQDTANAVTPVNAKVSFELALTGKDIPEGSTISLNGDDYSIFSSQAEMTAAGKNANNSIIVAAGADADATAANLAAALATKAAEEGLTATANGKTLTIEAVNELDGATAKAALGDVTFTSTATEFTRDDAIAALGVDIKTADDFADQENGVVFQIGANGKEDQRVELEIKDMGAEALGIAGVDLTTQEGANAAIDVIDKAINTVSAQRANLGALQNRLEHTINNLDTNNENLTASESRIRDVDMAAEMMKYTQNNVLVQAAQSMLAQANQQPQSVLSLLQ